MIKLLLLFLLSISQTSATSTLWPVPRVMNADGKANVTIDRANFRIRDSSNATILSRAAERYQSLIRNLSPPPAPPQQCDWQTANVQCSNDQDCSSWVNQNCRGEVAMWTDSYCPSPSCSINGSYGWMHERSQDNLFFESFSNMVFPHSYAAAGSLWSGYSSDLVPKGLPSDAFIDTLDAHTFRLRQRNISSCSSGCTCDWGSSCVGNQSAFYGGVETSLNENIVLRNTGCDVNVKVKQRSPCSKLNEDDLGVLTPNGDSFTVQGSDFILTASDHGSVKASDQFSLWIGDSTWMDVSLVLNVSCDDGSYIYMTPA